MLILSRRLGERILIGNVWVTIVRVRGGVVRVGIEAPADTLVLREELVKGDILQQQQAKGACDEQI